MILNERIRIIYSRKVKSMTVNLTLEISSSLYWLKVFFPDFEYNHHEASLLRVILMTRYRKHQFDVLMIFFDYQIGFDLKTCHAPCMHVRGSKLTLQYYLPDISKWLHACSMPHAAILIMFLRHNYSFIFYKHFLNE